MTVDTTNGAQVAVQQPTQPNRVHVPLGRPLADMDQAWRMAGMLSQSPLLPASLTKNPKTTQANVALILLYGSELGLSPMQSVQEIYVVNNRPQMSGRLWIAKTREAGHRQFVACKSCDMAPEEHAKTPGDGEHRFVPDHDATRCRVTIVRGDTGERHSELFTIADAEQAKLTGKDVWKSWPKRMLLWRAVSNCATIICPEVAMGFGAEDPEVANPGTHSDPAAALAAVVDARTPEDSGVVDAEVVDDEADEQARQELLEMQAAHVAEPDDEDRNPLSYSPDEIAEMS